MNINDLPSKVFHGTTNDNLKSLKDTSKINTSFNLASKSVDNGPGFYTGTQLQKAKKRANDKVRKFATQGKKNVSGIVLEYDIDLEKLEKENFKILIFEEPNEEWAAFVLNNRIKSTKYKHNLKNDNLNKYLNNVNQQFDLVYSPLADGLIEFDILDYLDSEQKYENILKFLDAISQGGKNIKELGDQLSIHKSEVIKHLSYKKFHV